MSTKPLSTVYNKHMDDDMLDTAHLFQPRGPGTAFLFRMRTPEVLIGRTNPRTRKTYGPEIREGLGGVRTLPEARKLRDLRLGQLRLEEAKARAGVDDASEVEEAMEIAAQLRATDDEHERETLELVVSDMADRKLEALHPRGAALDERDPAYVAPPADKVKRVRRWRDIATGERTPFSAAVERFKADRGRGLASSTLISMDTTFRQFMEFAGAGVSLEEVDRKMAGEFVATYLPNRKTAKAPEGQGAASIRKKVSQLTQVWQWAAQRGVIPYTRETPWDGQGPHASEIKKATKHRRTFTAEEARKLLAAKPAGDRLGDLIPVALLTGVRLGEVAGLDAAQVDPQGRWYKVQIGKSENAVRVVPLVGAARVVVKARLKKVNGKGPLFPEWPRDQHGKVRKVSDRFTDLRRKVLGVETNGEVVFHSFRHTWRTAARRAGVDLRTVHELGGWARGGETDLPYDHGLEFAQYLKAQRKVAQWLKAQGFWG